MGELRTDDGSGFASDKFTLFLEQHSVSIVIAAGEAHSSLGVVERRHQVVREAIELYCQDAIERMANAVPDEKLITEACIYAPHQVNRLALTKGYSPCQWVLGMDPTTTMTNSSDKFSPTTLYQMKEVEDFKDVLERRWRR
eukprot:4477122-Pyramimonas_sp.AAC.1